MARKKWLLARAFNSFQTHLLLLPLKQIKWKTADVIEIYRYQGSLS